MAMSLCGQVGSDDRGIRVLERLPDPGEWILGEVLQELSPSRLTKKAPIAACADCHADRACRAWDRGGQNLKALLGRAGPVKS